jgi:putative ABC transport system substrate-binding protein
MQSKHFITAILLIISITIGIALYKSTATQKSDHLFTIGILQTASHPALDAAREGFITEIKKSVGNKIGFVLHNGQGSISNIHTIAEQFHAKKNIDAIFAIATPAAQAMISVEKEKPIIICAVTVSPQLGISFAEKNICGVSDMINVKKEIEAMKALLPQEVKTVGILFCNAEVNAVAMSQVMATQLEREGYIPVLVGVTSEADIEPALLSAGRKVDAFLTPTDNVIANAITMITNLVQKMNKPLIVSDNMLVKYGALMARGVDYHQSGKQAGQLALQLLMHNKKPEKLSIMQTNSTEIFINQQVMKQFGLTVSDTIKNDVVFV